MDLVGLHSTEGEESLQLQIVNLKLSSNCGSGSTIFEPQREVVDLNEKRNISNTNIGHGPEIKLTEFALRLAVLEKTATRLGTLGFIWATVVLLGGFAITLDKTDFWFITTILLIEGARIFSRSHELEWQHQATWSITDAGKYSFRALQSSSHFLIQAIKEIFHRSSRNLLQSHEDKQIAESTTVAGPSKWDCQRMPTKKWEFLSRNISKFLYWLQLLSAIACVTLSLMRLIRHNYGEAFDRKNRKYALNIFYALALAEALLFLLERAYWEWKVTCCNLLEGVNRECKFGISGMAMTTRFFYDAYSRCVNGSIFDGMKMDLVSFAMDLLASNSSDEQFTGAWILRTFATCKQFSDITLQKIGISVLVMERLVEMLNWNNPQEEKIRRSAAEILSKLARKKQNSLRIAVIPGAMESISSLLYTDKSSSVASNETWEEKIICDQVNYEFLAFTHLGLLILKKLARDQDTCGKIRITKGLLRKIIACTHACEKWLRGNHTTESQITTVKRSLQVLKMLASTTGTTGKLLRKEILENVFTISNIREILSYGENHPMLQKLSIEILTSLALEEDAAESIGSTGGILKELFLIFFKQGIVGSENHVSSAAGEAITLLALESERNCHIILKLNVVEKLVGTLEDPVLLLNSTRILRNLCIHIVPDHFLQLKGVIAATPIVLKAIVSGMNKLQEVMLGLAAQTFRFMTSQESCTMFEQSGVKKNDLATKLVQILKYYKYPSIKVPRIRRFAIELAIWMMRDEERNVHIFKDLGMEEELVSITETTSELENFNIFSGTVGLCRYSTTTHYLVDTALKLFAEGKKPGTRY